MKIKTGIKAGAAQTRNQTRDQLKDEFMGGEQREAVVNTYQIGNAPD